MSEDYKRAVCNFCPFKTYCDHLRDKLWCGQCKIALVCTMTKDVGVTDCQIVRSHWRNALPGKCLCFQRAMSTFIRASTSLEGTREGSDGFVRDSRSQIFCPRCDHATVITRTLHDWKPIKGRISIFHGHCAICGLDEEIRLE